MARRVYVGWDSREDIAYQVARHSILRLSDHVDVVALKLHELQDRGLVTRDNDPQASTQFTFTRFLVPHLNQYRGWALFVDCDFLFRSDVNKLFDLADPTKAVMVAKHDYTVQDGSAKMDGQVQHAYPRKNWSSCILFNCAHPKNIMGLDPLAINEVNMSHLHQFRWLDDSDIGEIPHTWNWLVGHYHEPKDGQPDAIHYTLGGPWFPQYKDVEYSQIWNREKELYYKSW